MTTEQFANNGTTTLNGAINASVTSLVVTSATPFPAVPQFRIIVDSEIMLVTAVSGTTFTVSRGAENTTQASHSNGATVSLILTAGALNQAKIDAVTVRSTSSVQVNNYTLNNGDDIVLVNTTSNSFTVTLPASPTLGENHMIIDVGGQLGVNQLTISGNGVNIVTHTGATASTDTLGTNYATVHYIYNGTTWSLMRPQNALGTRIPTDSNDIAVWNFQESSAPFANTGTGGTDNVQVISGSTVTQASGLVLPYAIQSGIAACQLSTTSSNSATDTVIEPSFPYTISLWCKLTGLINGGQPAHLIVKLYRPYSTWTSPYVASEITLTNQANYLSLSTNCVIGGSSGGVTTAAPMGVGEWTHLGFTVDGTTLRQYVNGVQVGTASRSGTMDWGTHGPWIFGQNPAFTSEGNFYGLLQDVRIANVARSASWFRMVYRAGVGLPMP